MNKAVLAKVLGWRVCSISITGILTCLMNGGDIGAATTFTVSLHAVLVIAHYAYETVWEKLSQNQ